MNAMRVAVIGLGGMARRVFLPALAGKVGLELILSTRSEQTIRELQAQYRIPFATVALDEMLRMRPQAAFVLTPKETHFAIAQQLLKAGIDVFVEKPISMKADEAEQLAGLADAHGRILMVGFNRRFAPLHLKARELIAHQNISLALFQKTRTNSASDSLAEQYIEDTIHQIDLLRFYCSEGNAISTSQQIEDGRLVSAVSTVALANGGIAIIATCLNAGAWAESYTLHGSNQSVAVDAFDQLTLITPQDKQSWRESYASSWKTTLEGRGFQGEIDHFLECVQKRSQPMTSGMDSVKTLRLVEQMVHLAEPNHNNN